MKSLITILLLALAVSTAQAKFRPEQVHKPILNSAKFTFVENKGQWDSAILYAAVYKNLNLLITRDGIIYDCYVNEGDLKKGHVIKLAFDHRTISNKLKPQNNTGSYRNYFIGNDPSKWVSYAKEYSKLKIEEVFAGTDILFYTENNKPRFDFIIKQGSNPEDIIYNIIGGESVNIDQAGDLTVSTSIGKLYNGGLFAYQEINGRKQQVDCSFKVNGNSVSFDIGKFNNEHELIIDPLVYLSYIGGSEDDEVTSIKAGDDMSFVACGWTNSTDFYTAPGAYQGDAQMPTDAFVMKFMIDGADFTPVFSTYVGGAFASDKAVSLDCDNAGNIYVTGHTNSEDFPVVSGFNPDYSAEWDSFIFKLSPEGSSLINSSFIGGNKDDLAHAVRVTNNGLAFVAGETRSSDFKTTAGAIQGNLVGTSDAFAMRIESSGKSIGFSTYFGGTGNEAAYGIDIDESDALYITGKTSSGDMPIAPWRMWGTWIREKPYDHTYNGGMDAFCGKLVGNGGKFEYMSYFGGINDDIGKSVVYVGSGAAVFAGETVYEENSDFPVTENSFQKEHAGKRDLFICRFNELTETGSGQWVRKSMPLLYSSFIGGKNDEYLSYISLDGISNNIVMTGKTNSGDYPIVNDFEAKYAGDYDAFLTEVLSSGTDLDYSALFGGKFDDEGISVDLDSRGDYFLAGKTKSPALNTTSNALNEEMSGTQDGFIMKFVRKEMTLTDPNGGEEFCRGTKVNIRINSNDLGPEEKFKLEYMRVSGGGWITIAKDLVGRVFEWEIHAGMQVGSDYLLRVSHTTGLSDKSSSPFSIQKEPELLSFTYDPSVDEMCEGDPLIIEAVGEGQDLKFQWKFNGNDIPNETGSKFQINEVELDDAGDYSVALTGKCKPYTQSENVTVNVFRKTRIESHPESRQIKEGESVTFTIEASGKDVTYEWQKNGEKLIGQSDPILTIENLKKANEGLYRCVVRGQCGEVISEEAQLTVIPNTSVVNDSEISNWNIQVYNNSPKFELIIDTEIPGVGSATLYNNNGMKLKQLISPRVIQGRRIIDLEMEDYSSGIYWILVRFSDGYKAEKLILAR